VRLTTNAYPKEQRQEAWRFALQRLSIELLDNQAEIYGELVTFRTALDMQFIRIAGTRQSLAVDFSQSTPCIWLVLLLDGELTVTSGRTVQTIAEGGMVCGSDLVGARLDLQGDSRLLITRVPHALPALKSRTPAPAAITCLDGASGLGSMLSGLLLSVAETLDDIGADQMRPVEAALPEFIAALLLDAAPDKDRGGSAGGRASLLDRVFQTIEMRLSDPDLNLQQVAKEHGISSRYLQKLFASIDESFGHFLKARRLERCRLDLGSPLHAQKSISEILFQWGFNDSASFSRAFREQYGVSPRQYRKAPPANDENGRVLLRGLPASIRKPKRDLPSLTPIEDEDAEAPDAIPVEEAIPPRPIGSGVRHHLLRASPETIHWGYFSRALKPVIEIESGDYVTVETLTHHAYDDYERMIEGDPGAESVFRWTAEGKAVDRRGAGPVDGSALGRGAGEGFGVHICTGPIAIAGAKPGDVVEVKILEITPRPSQNSRFLGRTFGSNAAAYWGFHYNDLLTEPKPREVVTIYEVEHQHGRACAHAVYNYRWTPQTDPFGVTHDRIDYPGVPVDFDTVVRNFDVLRDIEVPVRPHFGVVAMAPNHADPIDSVPPSNFGGNIDNWRLGAGASLFLPVGVPGGLLSLGDPHASQGDSELCGTAIECSMTAVIQVILHPAKTAREPLRDLDYPLLETKDEWVIFGFSHPEYLKEMGPSAQSEVYKKSSLDLAMRDAFRKARRFLMTTRNLSEDEAISLLSVGVDFGVTQVANGNWGVHAVIRKGMFAS
jgi:acetamidase/formamidase/AraC-like DNA-binding protein